MKCSWEIAAVTNVVFSSFKYSVPGPFLLTLHALHLSLPSPAERSRHRGTRWRGGRVTSEGRTDPPRKRDPKVTRGGGKACKRRSHVPFVTAAMPFPGPLTVPFGARIVHNRGTPRDKGPRWTEDERRTDEPRIGLSFTSFVVRLSLTADPLSLTPFVTRDATVRSGPGLRPRVKGVVKGREERD